MFDNILLAGGDSFTAHIVDPNVAWPNHIKDWNAKVYSVAEMHDNELIQGTSKRNS